MISAASHYANMRKSAHKGTHFLREWREFRKMTQEELAAAVGTSKSVISEKESGERGLSNKWLERLAPALKVQKGWILEQDPNQIGADLLEIWGEIPATDRPRVLQILETFRKVKDAKRA
jgi:transcriptional regulator with XRE-family HTH domain